MTTYDMSIHTNPDARAWAKFFCDKYKVWSDDGVEIDSEELMIAWFANAMMAMHDHLMLTRIKELEAYADKCNTEMNALEDKLCEAYAMNATLSHTARVSYRWEQAEIDKVKAKVREELK